MSFRTQWCSYLLFDVQAGLCQGLQNPGDSLRLRDLADWLTWYRMWNAPWLSQLRLLVFHGLPMSSPLTCTSPFTGIWDIGVWPMPHHACVIGNCMNLLYCAQETVTGKTLALLSFGYAARLFKACYIFATYLPKTERLLGQPESRLQLFRQRFGSHISDQDSGFRWNFVITDMNALYLSVC